VTPEVIAEVLVVAFKRGVHTLELFIDELLIPEHVVADYHYVVVVHRVERDVPADFIVEVNVHQGYLFFLLKAPKNQLLVWLPCKC